LQLVPITVRRTRPKIYTSTSTQTQKLHEKSRT